MNNDLLAEIERLKRSLPPCPTGFVISPLAYARLKEWAASDRAFPSLCTPLGTTLWGVPVYTSPALSARRLRWRRRIARERWPRCPWSLWDLRAWAWWIRVLVAKAWRFNRRMKRGARRLAEPALVYENRAEIVACFPITT